MINKFGPSFGGPVMFTGVLCIFAFGKSLHVNIICSNVVEEHISVIDLLVYWLHDRKRRHNSEKG
jgi:hypothetical protein